VIDSQSVKNTDTAENRGYDAAKKISGIKRHLAVDTNGSPHAIHITTANVTDRDGAISMIVEHTQNLKSVKNLLVDAGYTGEQFALGVKAVIDATVEVVKRNKALRLGRLRRRLITNSRSVLLFNNL